MVRCEMVCRVRREGQTESCMEMNHQKRGREGGGGGEEEEGGIGVQE